MCPFCCATARGILPVSNSGSSYAAPPTMSRSLKTSVCPWAQALKVAVRPM